MLYSTMVGIVGAHDCSWSGDLQAIQTPDWVKHAVFLSEFPDRIARSPRSTPTGYSVASWVVPGAAGVQGSDLLGIMEQLDYLRLSVTRLYLTPIFASAQPPLPSL